MDIRNISIVFSPTLNIPVPVLLMFLSDFRTIFGDTIRETQDDPSQQPPAQTLTAGDIRSPRRQMFSDLPTPAYNQTSFNANQQAMSQNSAINGINSHQDLGFAPIHPSYDAPRPDPLHQQQQQQQRENTLQLPNGGLGIAQPRTPSPGDMGIKQSRRESSMLLMGPGLRKGSLPMLGNQYT